MASIVDESPITNPVTQSTSSYIYIYIGISGVFFSILTLWLAYKIFKEHRKRMKYNTLVQGEKLDVYLDYESQGRMLDFISSKS